MVEPGAVGTDMTSLVEQIKVNLAQAGEKQDTRRGRGGGSIIGTGEGCAKARSVKKRRGKDGQERRGTD